MSNEPVLIVEDNESDLDLTCFVFQKQKIVNDLILARDGEEALHYLFGETTKGGRERVPVFIILDLNLPGIGGLEVLRKIRSDLGTADVPVIVFTSSENRIDRDDSMAEGATRFVVKSGSHRKFMESVRDMITEWLETHNESDEQGNGHAG